MKKMYLALVAAVIAVGFSAFSTENTSDPNQPTYQDDFGVWHNFVGDPCFGSIIPECIKLTEDGARQLFYDENPDRPLKRD